MAERRDLVKLYLKNVGRISEAEIFIDGLTVICGDNNTGKSTIGKVLYCIYKAMHNIEENIKNEKSYVVSLYISRNLREESRRRRNTDRHYSVNTNREEWIESTDTIQREMDLIEYIVDHEEISLEEFSSYIHRLYGEGIDEDIIKGSFERIQAALTMDQGEILSRFLERYIDVEFGGKLRNVNHPEKGAEIQLKLRNGEVIFRTAGSEQEIELEKGYSLDKGIVYLDDPFLLDDMNEGRVFYTRRASAACTHRRSLLRMLQGERDVRKSTVEEILMDRKLKGILPKFDEISAGDIVFNGGMYEYESAKLKENLKMVSLSTGIKSFAVLKKLLKDGYIEENGIIVIDEPEVHLHPEWQMKYAEIVVMLQKEYGLNIVLATHSVDFLSALMYFSEKYEIQNVCNWYLAEFDRESDEEIPFVQFTNVNDKSELIYDSLSSPFLNLYEKMN